ncbi:MAG: hypothetical protein WCG75_00150 [Armatimonadota bacterium]
MKLLSVDTNAKTVKGQKRGFRTGILYLAPSNISGREVCPHASEACRAACLYSAGRGAFSSVQKARISKTVAYFHDKNAFLATLMDNVASLIKSSQKAKASPCVRLNGTSDISWERTGLMERFPGVPFYDYTKNYLRMLAYLSGSLPGNYSLTFSRSEINEHQCVDILRRGGNVAVVFRKALPENWNGFRVINGDENDLRFLDPRGVVVGLVAKGKAKADVSGFVVE